MHSSQSAVGSRSSENLHCLPADFPVVALRAPDGACATVALHGGHVLSWVPAGGSEMLYLSVRSGFAPGQAIRGGVPVIFPQFSDRGPLRRHGFARVLPWQLIRQEAGADSASAVLRLEHGPQSQAFWPHVFVLELTVRVGAASLSLGLTCRNVGADVFSFHAALHSYFRVHDLAQCRMSGLQGLRYQDALDHQDKLQAGDVEWGTGDLDRVYTRVPGPLRLSGPGGDGGATLLQIGQEGFEDVVVWNPGAGKCAALADMPADGWRHMACVEAARIARPVTLLPGEQWHGAQDLHCLTPSTHR
jgi:glucose-6-phosphate 1-epimerase